MRRGSALGVLAAAIAVPVALAASTVTYSGTTSQGRHAFMNVTANGHAITGGTVHDVLTCSDGTTTDPSKYFLDKPRGVIHIAADGRFRDRFQVDGTARDHRTFHATVTTEGTLNLRARSIAGDFRDVVSYSGGVACRSGRVTFRLRAK
ncbi:MAG TPA: hypothetical protein VIL64_06340 [Solirubrobacteraceae bacterium]